MYVVIKRINGRHYRYLQRSYRVAGRKTPKTDSKCLGPVTPGARNPKQLRGADVGLGSGVYSEAEVLLAVNKTFERQRWARDRMRARTAEEIGQEDKWRHASARWKEEARVSARERAHFGAKAARQTAQDAPGRAKGDKAKDFTVDDEIESREAKFEAAVDEYNAGTTAAPDAPAPDDAPSQS
jgi:hypothetical protein